jgi:biopolymer transport protein ExbD
MARKRKIRKIEYQDVELNIMPFIDIFSMLNTFLLFSAVFLSVGVLEVQIPFLSNAPPPEKTEDKREFKVSVDVNRENVEVQTSFTKPPEEAQKHVFPNTKEGLVQLHAKLVQIRQEKPETDKATVYAEDDVIWDSLSHVLDAVMLRQQNDPIFPPAKDALEGKENDPKAREKAEALAKTFVFPKIVMGSVMLN